MFDLKDTFISSIIIILLCCFFILFEFTLEKIKLKLEPKVNKKILRNILIVISLLVHIFTIFTVYSSSFFILKKCFFIVYLIFLNSMLNVHIGCLEECTPSYILGTILTILIPLFL